MVSSKLAALAALSLWPAWSAVLVESGVSKYSISISRSASPSEQRAARELQQFLAEMSGARLPIVTDDTNPAGRLILVGASAALDRLKPGIDFERLGPEGFALKTIGSHLAIAGGRQRGTMYGVYTLLEKLGCRWFARDQSRIPKTRTVRIGRLNEIHKPAFEYREPFVTEAFDKDWAARNKTNGNSSELDESTGGKVRYFPFVHSFYSLLPPDKYFKEHPEYYSLIDGARRVERGQLCLTSPDVLRIATAQVLDWIREHPEATILSVSQNDWEGWCECDNCRRVEQEEGGKHSGPLLRFVNAVAAEIEKQHPDKLIDTLAYWYTEDPPLNVRPRKNVRIRLCPIGVCEAHPYEQCPRSVYFVKNLKSWSRITDQLYIWHYNTNFSHYLAPFPDFDELAANIPLYRRSGVVGVFLEGSYPKGGGGEFAELRSYVMARLLWNPAIDVNREVDDFLEGYYGKAAPSLRAYFDLLHREARRGMHIWINPVPAYSDEFLARAARLFDKAEAAAGLDETIRARVRKARLPVEYMEFLRAKRYTLRDGWYAPADLPALKNRFQSLVARLRGFGITSIHEGRDLAADEKEFAAYMKRYRVVTIENERLRADVAPELNGRVVRLFDKTLKRDLLRTPDTGERNYPDTGGLGLWAYSDFHSAAWQARWEPEAAGTNELVLRGTVGGRLVAIERRLSLDGGVLRMVTTLENRESAPLQVVLQSRADLAPADIDTAVVRFHSQAGAAVERRLIQPEQPPQGAETFQGPAQPDGLWRVENIVNQFPAGQIERCFLNWTAKGAPRVTLGVWSRKVALKPGEKVTLEGLLACPTLLL